MCAGWARAQDPRAALLGVVVDPAGGAAPAAHLTAIHTATETRYSAESDGGGNYVIPYLPPGAYRLRVELEGFRTYERGPIELRIADRVRIDVKLLVGRLTATVWVTPETPQIHAAEASMGSVISGRRITELPVPHGNPFHLAQLSGGVAYTGNASYDRPFEPTHIASYSIGGAYSLRNEITLDGMPNLSVTAGRNQTAAAYVPPADIVDEMKITTAPFDAAVGHTEGGVIAVSLKSGGNTAHATAYFNNQNPALSANSWMANKRGDPRPDFGYNRWGGSLLGPLRIPRVYNGTNRTFFLWGYEGIHERRPRNLGIITVPTARERDGDFSTLLGIGKNYQLYDPATRRVSPAGGIVSDPIPGNIIAPSRINPIAKNILRHIAYPNLAGTADGRNNLARTDLAEGIAYQNQAWRLDHNLSQRHHVFGSAAMYTRTSGYLNYFDDLATGEVFQFVSRRAALDDVFAVSPNLVLNFRAGYNRFVRSADFNPESHGFDLTTLAPGNPNWAAWNGLLDKNTRRFPLIDIAGYYNLIGTSSSGMLFRPQDTASMAFSADAIHGPHTLKSGAEYRVYRKAETNPYPASTLDAAGGSATGWLRFAEDWTKGPTDTSGAPPISAGLASFLLGNPTGGGIDRRASFAEQSTVSALYSQDDWRVTRKLTVTLGLRYELEGPLTERYNRSVRSFDPAALLPVSAGVEASYAKIAAQIPQLPASRFAVRGGLTFPGVNGEPRALYGRDTSNLMPRVGLAYGIGAKTVVRAGYGVFFGAMGIRRGDVYQTGFSYTTPLVPSQDNGLTFVATLDNPFPAGAVKPTGSSTGVMTNAGDRISYFNTHFVAPYMQRWQFSLQRELPGKFFVDAGYVGNRGVKLETTRNLNGIPLAYLSSLGARDQAWIDTMSRQDLANPFYSALPATSPLGSTRNTSRAALLTAYPQFTRVETTTNEGYSWYHSLVIQIDRRFSRGYTAGASYTWSKRMEATAFLNEMDAAPYRTISASDYPHRLSVNWIYELPFGRGRAPAGNAPRGIGRILGGWQIEGLCVYQSGAPLGFDNIGFTGDIKNIPLRTNERTAERWFDTNAGFVRDSSQALAYNLRTFPLRFSGIRGPGISNWDLSMLKNTKLGDRLNLQLRSEFLNARNHVWFGTPNTDPTSSAFGVITSEQGSMRRVQLGLKLIY